MMDASGSSRLAKCVITAADVEDFSAFKTPKGNKLLGSLKNVSTDSPVSQLAKDMGDLSTSTNNLNVFPRRKLSLSGGTPNSALSSSLASPGCTSVNVSDSRRISVDEGCSVESPLTPTYDSPFLSWKVEHQAAKANKCYKTLPLSFYGFGPKTLHALSASCGDNATKSCEAGDSEECSQDSGIGTESSVASPAVLGDRTNFMAPTGTQDLFRRRPLFKRTLSMPASTGRANATWTSLNLSSPQHGRFDSRPSLLSPVPDEVDDGFAELPGFGTDLETDDSAPKCSAADKTSCAVLSRKRRRGVADEMETENLASSRPSLLHVATSPSGFADQDTPTSSKQSVKRVKESPDSVFALDAADCQQSGRTSRHRLVRCHSEAVIHLALSMSDDHSDLIGDFSRPYSLPVLSCAKHQDLKSIGPDTMARVLNNESNAAGDCVVVDCRYPYEYDGGHVMGGKNIYTKDGIIQEFLKAGESASKKDCNKIVIFHCEFSSERGPKLMRFLRNKDRDGHRDSYPKLSYPECYLLEGGYRAFYEAHPELCEPRGYRTMIDPRHAADLKHFRSKSRSWPVPNSEDHGRERRSRSCLKL